MFAGGECPSGVAEEVVEDSLFVEVTVSETLELDVGDLDEPGFVDVFFKLFEFGFGAEELGASDV